MSSAVKKSKKKKQVKPEGRKEKEPAQVVTCTLADNKYTGYIREGQLGSKYLDSNTAKYTWKTGIRYEGPFAGSQIEGKGKFFWPDGSAYEGELKGGMRHGQGLYIAADTITRYEGQWRAGQRHGQGRLTYNEGGTSYYEGSWQDGKKHGWGRQVWPSGNCYEGQWGMGQMRGHGSMRWVIADALECYSGNWEANQPNGEGTHTWHAPEPKSELGTRDASQQLNNRYKGQWLHGQRHGVGIFYYANGGRYHGEWRKHLKQGHGRHTFDDGRVYDGAFEDDQIAGPTTMDKLTGGVGPAAATDDNPIRRMIDITDIEVVAIPADRCGYEVSHSSSYTEPAKIMREVYNMLLRHLGDLKELYYRYRTMLPLPGEDPFCLSNHQFWLFARDAGLATPTCTLCRLDRHITQGKRHHREIAPEDAEELRPLTPRPGAERRGSIASLQLGQTGVVVESSSQAPSQNGSEDTSSVASSAGSPLNTANAVGMEAVEMRRSATLQETPAASPPGVAFGGGETRLGEAVGNNTSAAAIASAGDTAPSGEGEAASGLVSTTLHQVAVEGGGPGDTSPGGTPLPRHAQIKRNKSMANIHSASKPLLFRSFLEGIVRLALVRFPNEKSLETQAQRIFKERVLPLVGQEPASEKAFAFLADADFRRVLDEFEHTLWRLFRGCLLEESCGTVVAASRAAAPAAAAATATGGSSPGLERLESAADGGGCAGHGSGGGSYGDGHTALRISHFGDLGYALRQSHVQARLDITIRVKDLLRLLDSAGLLKPFTEKDIPSENMCMPIFNVDDEDFLVLDERELEALQAARESGSSTPSDQDDPGDARNVGIVGRKGKEPPRPLIDVEQGLSQYRGDESGTPFGNGAFGGMGALGPLGNDQGPKKNVKRKGDRGREEEEDAKSASRGGADGCGPLEACDVSRRCDFTVTARRALQLVIEVTSSQSVRALAWQLDSSDYHAMSERISLLEYMEMELVYSEFLRILVRIADLGTRRDLPLCDRLPLHTRFEGFLRYVFLPSLCNQYVPPRPPLKEEKARDEAELVDEPVDREPSEGQGRDQADLIDEGEPSQALPEEGGSSATGGDDLEDEHTSAVLQLWRGFDDGPAEAEVALAPRRWPQGYEQEVAAWA